MHALIVEDEPALQVFYQRVLDKVNYTTSIARDGGEAINWLQNHPTPHLILLDVRLPSVNGIDVVNFIAGQVNLQTAHVVIASASQEYEKYAHGLPSGEFLLKPILPAQLLEIAATVAERETI